MLRLRNKTFSIVGLYALSILMLSTYWYMDNSTKLNDFLKKADRVSTSWEFGFYAIVGLIKYGLLITGIAIPLILTTLIVMKRKTPHNN